MYRATIWQLFPALFILCHNWGNWNDCISFDRQLQQMKLYSTRSLSLASNPITALNNNTFGGILDKLDHIDISSLHLTLLEVGFFHKMLAKYISTYTLNTQFLIGFHWSAERRVGQINIIALFACVNLCWPPRVQHPNNHSSAKQFAATLDKRARTAKNY